MPIMGMVVNRSIRIMYYDELFEKALKDAKEENFAELKFEVADMQRNFENFMTKFFNSCTHDAEKNFGVTAM